MISAIENSPSMDVTLNSQEELFFYDMYMTFETKNIDPNTFRQISTSDWRMMKDIRNVVHEKAKVWKAQEEEKLKMKMEMERRLRHG